MARQESAAGLVKATRASYDAALAGFDRGLVPVQDVLTAQAAWSQAIALQADSDSAIAATLAGLAFGSGKIEAWRHPPRAIATTVRKAEKEQVKRPFAQQIELGTRPQRLHIAIAQFAMEDEPSFEEGSYR